MKLILGHQRQTRGCVSLLVLCFIISFFRTLKSLNNFANQIWFLEYEKIKDVPN